MLAQLEYISLLQRFHRNLLGYKRGHGIVVSGRLGIRQIHHIKRLDLLLLRHGGISPDMINMRVCIQRYVQ
ncbi:hypothetical protein D3C73_1499480 [compost metagenome]